MGGELVYGTQRSLLKLGFLMIAWKKKDSHSCFFFFFFSRLQQRERRAVYVFSGLDGEAFVVSTEIQMLMIIV